MTQLATAESLRALEEKHDEVLSKLDALCAEIEGTLNKVTGRIEFSDETHCNRE